MKCYLCLNELNDHNKSKEHILLNAIGGKLKSTTLLCKSCNSNFGSKTDAILAKQLSFISAFLQVQRDNKNHPTIKGGKTENGDLYNLQDGMTPIMSAPKITKETIEGEIRYHIVVRNEQELQKKILEINKKNEGQIKLGESKIIEKYMNEPISFETEIGGDLAFKSIAKTAINYYIEKTRDIETVKHLFDFILNKTTSDIVKYFFSKKPLYKKEKGEVSHIIHLEGNKYEKTLYCYIELFSSYSFLITLSDNYSKNNFVSTYCYDVLKNKELKKTIKLKKTIEENYTDEENMVCLRNNLLRVMDIGMKIQQEKQCKNIIEDALNKVTKKYNQDVFTREMMTEFIDIVSFSFSKFLMRGKQD